MLQEDLPDKSVLAEIVSMCYPEWDTLSSRDEILRFRNTLNIEHIFNMIESLDDLRRIILRRSDLSELEARNSGDENYLSRLQCLVARYLWEQSLANSPNGDLTKFVTMLTPNDAIITFNWDLLIERALDAVGVPWSYLPQRDTIFICKLHGSANWLLRPLAMVVRPDNRLKCTEIGYGISVVAEPVGATYERWAELSHGSDPRMALGYVPRLLAFGFRKDISKSPFLGLWVWASRCMSMSFRILIIGYSLPDADLAARHLLNYSLKWHRLFSGLASSDRRIVINPDQDWLKRLSSACANDCVVQQVDAMDAIDAGINMDAPDVWY